MIEHTCVAFWESDDYVFGLKSVHGEDMLVIYNKLTWEIMSVKIPIIVEGIESIAVHNSDRICVTTCHPKYAVNIYYKLGPHIIDIDLYDENMLCTEWIIEWTTLVDSEHHLESSIEKLDWVVLKKIDVCDKVCCRETGFSDIVINTIE